VKYIKSALLAACVIIVGSTGALAATAPPFVTGQPVPTTSVDDPGRIAYQSSGDP